MTVRAAALATLIAAMGVALALPAASDVAGGFSRYRLVAVWGAPVAAALAGYLFMPRLPAPATAASPRKRWMLWAAGLASLALAFALDVSFLATAELNWVTFTYGDQSLFASIRSLAWWGLPLGLVLGLGVERTLRGGVVRGLAPRLGTRWAFAASIAAGALFALPQIFPGGSMPEPAYSAATVVSVLCREVAFAALVASGMGIGMAGLYRGFLFFVEALLIADWYALPFPATNYVSADPRLYLARAVSALLALGVVLIVTRSIARPLPYIRMEEPS